MSKATIWTFLKRETNLPDVAIAGSMGNLMAESGCESCRLQGDFLSDSAPSKDYARKVNSNLLPNWYADSKGWGLAQWTYWTRKQNLKKACDSYGTGIEDETAQLRFMLAEMQNEYASMWRQLLIATDIRTATYLVCHFYEAPAYENVDARAEFGKIIFDEFHGKDVTPDPEPEPTPDKDDKLCKAIDLLLQALELLKEIALNS